MSDADEILDPFEQAQQRLLEVAEHRYHYEQWQQELKNIAANSKGGSEFKRAIEDAGNIIAKDSRGMVILGANIGDGDRYHTRLDGKLAGRSDENFKTFVSTIERAQLPTPEEGKAQLTSREEERSYQRTLSTGKIYDLTCTADDAQGFKSGLEEEGMILAREGGGKFSRTVVVDQSGERYDLAHIVTPLRAAEFDKMMASVDPLTLPTVETAKALQAQKQALDPELDALLKSLSARQAKEAQDLANRQESQIHGNAPNWLIERHEKEREDQQTEFAEERERYTAEHNEAKHMLEEMRAAEKQRGMEHGEAEEKGFSM